MAEYIHKQTGKVISLRKVRDLFPNVIFPKNPSKDNLKKFGVEPILSTPRPDPTADDKVVLRNGAELDTLGNWVQVWIERDRFADILGGKTKIQQDAEYAAHMAQLAQDAQDKQDEIAASTAAKEAIKADTVFGQLTAAQANSYIQNNVSDLASAKTAMKKLAKFIIYLRDRKG